MRHVRGGALAGLALCAAAVAVGGCSPGHLPKAPPPPTTSQTPKTSTSSGPAAASSTTTTAPVPLTTTGQPVALDSNASAAVGVGPEPQNWDIHAAGAARWEPTLRQVLAQVWPSAFYVTPAGVPEMNSALLQSATEVSTSPQVVVYQLNPRAVWSDGAPITYADFVYNWEAQCGCTDALDANLNAFHPLGSAGYDDISNVSGRPADPSTVTVTFSTPYTDWRSLFSYLMPAHIAKKVGFDSGFTDPVADLVSGGPFMVAEAQDGYSLELVRNARYWGSPANLAGVTYYFSQSGAELGNSLLAGELDLATVPATPALYQQLQAQGGLSVKAVASVLYEDLDFNQRTGLLAAPVVRHAIMLALDRTSMGSVTLGPYGLASTPVENRVFLPGSPGYVADGSNYDSPQAPVALQLLEKAGYKLAGQVLHAPGGEAVDLSLEVQADDPVAVQLAQQVAAGCAAIGISVSVARYGPVDGDLLGTGPVTAPPAGWQMAIELRAIPAFPSQVISRYRAHGASDVDGYASASMQGLLAVLGRTPAAGQDSVYDQVDTRAWRDFIDLPLVQLPVLEVTNPKLLYVPVGPYFSQVGSNEEDWGFPQ